MRKKYIKKITPKVEKNWQKDKKKEWDQNANFWIKIIRKNLDPYRLKITNKAILHSLKQEKQKIFEAGCGEGYLARTLAKDSHQIEAMDLCPQLIKAAQQLEKKEPLGINFMLGDFCQTNLPSSSFDTIISHQAIHEIKDPKKAFQEFYRLLKKKGELIMLFLHPCFEIEPSKYLQKVKIEKSSYLVSGIKSPSPYFCLHLPLSQWSKLLAETGFLIKKIEEPHLSKKLIKEDKWWKENFSKPLFILIKAVKN